jgi:biopolymer transport protein TolR
MAMETGAGKRDVVAEPNIVPLIDVLLVLIIIFMVITPLASSGLPVLLPPPAPKSDTGDAQAIVVQVLEGGKVRINEDAADWSTLGQRLSAIFKQRATRIAFLTGAEEISFSQVARAIGIMEDAGIDHVGLITASAMPINSSK